MAPLIGALKKCSWADLCVMFTGQHRELAAEVILDFGVTVDVALDVMLPNQSLSVLTGRLLAELESQYVEDRPDFVLAQGDTTTVMAAALSCFYANIPFGHVEAGLRTGNLRSPFPEEFNRLVCGHLAVLHFAPTNRAAEALLAEGVDRDRISVVGNTGIDALLDSAANISDVPYPSVAGRHLVLLTAHRRENFGAPLENVLKAVRDVVELFPDVELLYPVHPNPSVKGMAEAILGGRERIHLCAPLSYLRFSEVLRRSFLVVTDSGGVQEEAPALGKPVLVVREDTERPEAVECGAAKLVGTSYQAVYENFRELLADPKRYDEMARGVSPYGDGQASARIVDRLEVFFGIKSARTTEDFAG